MCANGNVCGVLSLAMCIVWLFCLCLLFWCAVSFIFPLLSLFLFATLKDQMRAHMHCSSPHGNRSWWVRSGCSIVLQLYIFYKIEIDFQILEWKFSACVETAEWSRFMWGMVNCHCIIANTHTHNHSHSVRLNEMREPLISYTNIQTHTVTLKMLSSLYQNHIENINSVRFVVFMLIFGHTHTHAC